MTARGLTWPATSWTNVMVAKESGSPEAASALERLCTDYWYPVYACLRRRGSSPHQAHDLTQEFFYRSGTFSSVTDVRVTKVIASQYNNYFLMVARKDPPAFIGPLFNAGNIHLRWQGHEGDNYQVEGSTDLRSWARVSDIIPGADRLQEFVDMGAARRPMRLYRLVTLP